jgi:drug/metabolite transporter (DMT)-like permease
MVLDDAATATSAQSPATRPRNNQLGIFAVIGAGMAMMSTDACLRLAIPEIGLGEAIMGRGILTCLILSLIAIIQGVRWRHPGMRSPALGVRIAGEVGAGMMFNAALKYMPIANATAILQFIPLVTTVAAAWLFAERVGWQRWLAAFAGLIGVLLILKPGTAGFAWWSLWAVAAMLCMSIRDLATSRIDPTTPTLPIGAVSAAFAGLSSLILLPLGPWPVPSLHAASMVFAAAVLMSAGFVCLVVAMRNAEMSALAPFRYFTILWAILLGLVIWGEIPDLWAILGILIVVGAGLVSFMRERRLARSRRPA